MSNNASTIHKISRCILEILSKIDPQTTAVASKTGLSCPPNCGRCCHNPRVEAMPLELLPLVVSWLDTNQSLESLRNLIAQNRRRPTPDKCPLFIDQGGGQGRCSVYGQRPSLCRLFGYGARVAQGGSTGAGGRERLEFMGCFYHGEIMAGPLRRASLATSSGLLRPPVQYEIVEEMLAVATSHGLDIGPWCQPMAIGAALEFVVDRAWHQLDQPNT